MKNLFRITALLAMAVMFLAPADAIAQKKKKGKKGDPPATEKEKDKSYKEIVEKCVAIEGLFTMYRDTATGESYIEIQKDQLDKEYIYFSYVENGVLDAGFFRGAYRSSKILKFNKVYERVEITEQNTDFMFDPNNALSKASEANINVPVLASEKIKAEDEAGKILISGDAIFLSETFQMIKPPADPKRPGFLGNLSKDKTRIDQINNYPENLDVVVAYVYENRNPRRFGTEAVTDVRNITVKYQHSLIEVPENDYKPRRDDHRLGYFMTQRNDMTSFSATPYDDVIHRWNLQKKDPSAAVSEPVEPITYWVENTTPEEFRPIIVEGVERWNVAFEKAGFKNAVVCKIQPDDADWDAGDIRYNVIRWTSSPIPPFGGYGPSFVNPRTGQILGADIMIEFASVTGRLFKTEVFELAGLPGYQMQEESEEVESMPQHDQAHFCEAGMHAKHCMMFGLHTMRAMNVDEASQKDFVKQTLYRLVLHETGHTLGLSHNMRGSTLQSVAGVQDSKLVGDEGLCNSVMEYPSINYALDKEKQTLFYDEKPGLYDHWVIEYGYSAGLEDEAREEERLENILSRSTDPKLAFGNDADDMRSPGKGIDPDVNIYDLSSDPVAYAVDRCELVNKILPKIQDTYTLEGQTYHELRNAYYVLTGEYGTQLWVMSRQIGGVHYNRAQPEQNPEGMPYVPVAEDRQKAAMGALAEYAFSPDAFSTPENLYNYLQGQRRGFSFFGRNEDPKIHSRVLFMQSMVLTHLLHKNTLMRISDSELYGNEYTLSEMMGDLTDGIFKADLRSKVNTFRQQLQISYVNRLIKMHSEKSGYDYLSKSMSWYELDRIEKMMKGNPSSDTSTKAHRNHVLKLIKDAKEA